MRRMSVVPAAGVAVVLLAAGLIAGPLTPSVGPVTSTYKTLDQVEPRIPLTSTTAPGNVSVVHVITQPGSYYLTGNVTGVGKSGIFIECENVTLDLNGYTVSTNLTDDGSAGIWFNVSGNISNGRGIVIRNGTVKGGGYASVTLNGAVGGKVENLSVSNTIGTGIQIFNSGHVKDCTVYGGFSGIDVAGGSLVENCVVSNANTRGIAATSSTIRNCVVSGNGSPFSALYLRGDCLAEHNQISAAGSLGLSQVGIEAVANTTGNRIINNHIQNIRWAVYLNTNSTNNFVANNTARNCFNHYASVSSPNAIAPIITNAGASFTATNPFTNFAW
ncbi:MAG: right-handed parallel beta-helix repeat-containing protein [Phycisphaerales bacterium]|nr:right-handed parallel beta-helix repeat-containing protein [Phycisphaerales bacterium]